MPEPIIRPYRAEDLPALAEICLLTGDAGGDARHLYANQDLLPDLFARPYALADPGLAFVVDGGSGAVGYILGTADTAGFVRWFRETWVPRVAHRHPLPLGKPGGESRGGPRSDEEFWTVQLHNPEWMLRPELGGYPAHLHIDLLPAYQRRGLGRALMVEFLSALHARGVPGVHLAYATRNTAAGAFYARLGFHPLEVADDGATFVGRGTDPSDQRQLAGLR
jgi:ribosomal protein S18 acetylase RimI-like enzyme